MLRAVNQRMENRSMIKEKNVKSMTTRDRASSVKAMFRPEGIDFSNETGWQVLAEHIEMHRYHVNSEYSLNATWQEAAFSWYENVFTPLMRMIDNWEVRSAFPGRTTGDLFLGVSDHWLYLKEREPRTTAAEAARSFVGAYGQGLARWFSRFLFPMNEMHD